MNESQAILFDRSDRIIAVLAGDVASDNYVVRYCDYVALRNLAFQLLEGVPIEQLSTLEIAEYLAKRIAFDERKIRENDE